jgi:hypothetical protein
MPRRVPAPPSARAAATLLELSVSAFVGIILGLIAWPLAVGWALLNVAARIRRARHLAAQRQAARANLAATMPAPVCECEHQRGDHPTLGCWSCGCPVFRAATLPARQGAPYVDIDGVHLYLHNIRPRSRTEAMLAERAARLGRPTPPTIDPHPGGIRAWQDRR